MVRILVVEDDQETRDALAEILSELGVMVQTATDGLDALSKLITLPDLIISDLNMPRLDGYGLIDKMKNMGIKIPLILFTAALVSRPIDCEAVIRKPTDVEALLETVCKLI